MNTSLRLIIYAAIYMNTGVGARAESAYVFVLDMVQQFEFTISSLAQDRRAKWLHDLLDRGRGTRKLVLCGTVLKMSWPPLHSRS